jgi:hypothetical protein
MSSGKELFMRPASDHLTRVSIRALSLMAGIGLWTAGGCSFESSPSGNNNNDAGNNSGSGGTSSSGSGGTSSSGSGGVNSGSGGDSATGGASGTGGAVGGSDSGSGGSTGTGGDNGSGGASGTGGVMIGPPIALPMAVTDYFDNQGWFGDQQEMMAFKPGATVINQAESATGPCAKRVANARGKCLKVVFTPPAGITPQAMGAYIGVFLLTTVKNNHPDATPPETIGQANWGASEPGVNIAPGATKIAFRVATDAGMQTVAFKAGAGPDSFAIPEMVMTAKTAWQAGSLSLAGLNYGHNVVGGFAWVLTNTAKAATFYIDDIVWTM